ncbi:MAG: ubiquitin-specific protease doa4 [Geoglossum simile]|nr:MAG: ubiquitin-specific protease doa4 [Geoglossum simile]
MDGIEKATSGDGSASGSRGNPRPGRVYPHLEDLVVKANVQLNIHTPIRKVLIEAGNCLKQADLNLELQRLDNAYVEYLTAYNIVVNFIPHHKEYPSLSEGRSDLWRTNKELQKRLSARIEGFDTVRDLIKQNNTQSGIQSQCSTNLSSFAPTVGLQTLGVPNGDTIPISDQNSDIATPNGDADSRLGLKPVASTQLPPQIQSSHTPPVGPLRRKPVVQPKPEGLVGRVAILNGPPPNGKSTPTEADPLAERFAKLRSTDDASRPISQVAVDLRPSSPASRPLSITSFHEAYPPVTMPSPSDFVSSSSIASPFTSPQANSPPHPTPPLRRPLGPRDMLPTRIGPPYPFETPLNTQFTESMPKAPSPTYSPARNLPTPANINPPRSTARSLVGTERRVNIDNPTQTTGLEIPTNASENAPYLPPPPGIANGVARVKRKPVELPREAEITAEKLYNYLNRGSDQLSVLLIDVRDREDFDEGHIFSQSILCIEPIVLRPEMSADELEETLVLSPENEQNLFSRREKFDLVVYYDQTSTTNRYLGGPTNRPQERTLRALTQAIYEFSYSKPLQRPPVLLVGGLNAWVNLVGRQALKTSDSAGTDGRRVMQRRRTLEYEPLDVEEERAWLARVQGDISHPPREEDIAPGESKPSQQQSTSLPQDGDKWNRTYDDFLRHPDPSRTQESMVSAAPVIPRSPPIVNPPVHVSSASGFEPLVPVTPSRPPPAVPRRSYGGVSERAPYQPTHQSLPPPIAPPRASQFDTISSYSNSSLGKTGLENLGNTCYMNSVIQCLSGTFPVRRYFQDGSYKRDIQLENEWGTKGLMPEIYASLIRHLWDSYSYISPKTFREFCGRLRPDFKTSEQQDAAEFLTFLMDYLHEDLNINSNRSPLKALNEAEERRREALPIQIASRVEWDRRTHNNHSQISSRFSVQYASRLKCLTCNTTSTSYGTEYCIPLEIPARGRIDIYECLKNYTKEERFEKENNWRCPSCKKIRESTRKITITRAPEILVINLKRFHNRGAQTTKIKTWVDFPLNDLDMTPFVAPPLPSHGARQWPALLSEPLIETTPPFKYGLYGVVNHYGSGVKSGHYIALRRVTPSTWTEFNDRYVTDIDPRTVVSDAAYLLFFYRSAPQVR